MGVYRRVEVKDGREGASLRRPQLQLLVVRAREECVRIERIEGEVRDAVGVSREFPVVRGPRDAAHGTKRVEGLRIRAGLEVPDLDAALGAAREEDTAIELLRDVRGCCGRARRRRPGPTSGSSRR